RGERPGLPGDRGRVRGARAGRRGPAGRRSRAAAGSAAGVLERHGRLARSNVFLRRQDRRRSEGMKRTRMITALAAAVVLLPASSWAFSFGSFAPGEKIVSIQLAAGSSPTVSFDGTTNTMVFDASVSTITTNLGVYSIPLGDVG